MVDNCPTKLYRFWATLFYMKQLWSENREFLYTLSWNRPFFQLTITCFKMTPCWIMTASYALGHSKQSEFIQSCLTFLCFVCPRAELLPQHPQHGGFCTTWPLAPTSSPGRRRERLCELQRVHWERIWEETNFLIVRLSFGNMKCGVISIGDFETILRSEIRCHFWERKRKSDILVWNKVGVWRNARETQMCPEIGLIKELKTPPKFSVQFEAGIWDELVRVRSVLVWCVKQVILPLSEPSWFLLRTTSTWRSFRSVWRTLLWSLSHGYLRITHFVGSSQLAHRSKICPRQKYFIFLSVLTFRSVPSSSIPRQGILTGTNTISF